MVRFFLVTLCVLSLRGASDAADVVRVPGSTRKVRQLTGERDLERLEPAPSRTSSRFGLRGTDLGSSFEHNGRLYFLFGDTWEGRAVAGVSGVPSFIQSEFGAKGNFEVVAPLAAGGLAHFWRDNDAPGFPWHGPIVFGESAGFVDAVSLIEGNFGSPGNLEVVARAGDRLITFWRGGDGWHGPFPVVVDGAAVMGISGNPSLIQSTLGVQGDFEVVVPLRTGGLAHYRRDNDASGFPWHGPIVFGEGGGPVDSVSLIQSNFGSPGNLEVVARAGDRLIFFWRDADGWHGPFPVVADGAAVTGVSGNPALVQGKFGVQGNFEALVPRAGGGLVHFWRDNDAPGFPWHGPIPVASRGGTIDAVTLIQSNFGSPGNFEVVARAGDHLVFLWQDGGGWHDALMTLDVQVASPNDFRYRDSDAIASTTDTNPDDGLVLDFVTAEDGAYLSPRVFDPVRNVYESLSAFEVPAGGFSAGGKMYVFFTTDRCLEGGCPTMGRSLLAFADDPALPFVKLYDVSRRADEPSGGFKFINVSPRVVKNAAILGLPERLGDGLLVWGSGRYRESDLFLAFVPLLSVDRRDSWRYFAGLMGGAPRWSGLERDAAPLLGESCVGEFSVDWNPFLEKWLVLYNCDSPRGIVFRTADSPWGPWSEPALLFDPWPDGGYCGFMHADWRFRNCDSVYDGMFGPTREFEWGGEYGPYLISRFTTGNETSSTIYFVLSTWNPYNTVLMKSTLRWNSPPRGKRRPGDCNQDARLDIADVICLLGHIFRGSPDRLPCGTGLGSDPGNRALLDLNDDGRVDLADAVFALFFLFANGQPPGIGLDCKAMPGCSSACQGL